MDGVLLVAVPHAERGARLTVMGGVRPVGQRAAHTQLLRRGFT